MSSRRPNHYSEKNGHFKNKLSFFYDSFLKKRKYEHHSLEFSEYKNYILTKPDEAVSIIEARRQDPSLQKAVADYLDKDIPVHFNQNKPVLYLSRHLATPNLETLKFIEVAKPYALPIIIGEDHQGKFVSINADKRSLGKMQIIKGSNRRGDDILENFTVIDFKKYDGEEFKNIKTVFDEDLAEFHHSLLHEVYPPAVVTTVNESAWVDRNFRQDLMEHYRRLMALLIVHGIMFEVYYPEEKSFFDEILIPAFTYIHKKFGVKPLICPILDDTEYDESKWITYPSVIYPFVSRKF
jgi:hypothetical protein